MKEFTFSDIEVLAEDKKTKLVLEWIGEGVEGDYRPDDPEDYPHLRFSLYKKNGARWEQVEDASYCTRLDGRLPREQLTRAAQWLLSELEGCHHVKKRGEELSWIDHTWLASSMVGDQFKGRTCPHCNNGKLIKIAAREPLYSAHWSCPECDSTYCDENGKPVVEDTAGDEDDESYKSFSTTCPHCKKTGCLEIVHFQVNTRIPLSKDGFATTDAEFFDTSDEIVHCTACDKEFPLGEVML